MKSNTLKFNDQIKWYQWWRGTYLIIQVIQLLYNFNNEGDPSRKKTQIQEEPGAPVRSELLSTMGELIIPRP